MSNCGMCFVLYDRSLNKPRTLECGHTFCSECINKLILSNPLCPFCRSAFSQKNLQAIPVSFAVMDLCDELEATGITNKFFGTSNKNKRLFNMQKQQNQQGNMCKIHNEFPIIAWCQTCDIWVCVLCSSQHNKQGTAICQMVPTDKGIAINKNQLQTEVTSLMSVLGTFEVKVNGVKNNLNSVESKVRYWKSLVSNDKRTSEQSRTVCQITNAKDSLEIHKSMCLDWVELNNDIGIHQKTNMGGNSAAKNEVFALKKVNQMAKWGRVIRSNNQMIIHTLDSPVPGPYASITQFNDLVKEDNHRIPQTVFIDYGWNKVITGRLIIDLTIGSDAAKNFFYLITGQYGITYKNKQLKKWENSCLYCPNTENSATLPKITASNTPVIMSQIGDIKYNETKGNGLLEFNILHNSNRPSNNIRCIGKIKEGLQQLLNSMSFIEAGQVYMYDCGVIVRK